MWRIDFMETDGGNMMLILNVLGFYAHVLVILLK